MRKFWEAQSLHTENASFHIVISSYQLVILDVKYFQRIKWQYLVLDEAQAIKSSSRYIDGKPMTVSSCFTLSLSIYIYMCVCVCTLNIPLQSHCALYVYVHTYMCIYIYIW